MRLAVFFLSIIVLPCSALYAQNPVQTIRGEVTDANTREKLFGANVVLLQNKTGTITNNEGKFKLENVPVGRYRLQVSFIGYEPVIIPELLVSSGKEVVLDIQLVPSVSQIDEITVRPDIRKDRPLNSMAEVSARTFSVEEAGRYAGSLDDPGRMAGNFAGVTTMGVSNNAIAVRGNAPKGLLWRLEGVDIPVPSHFSGSNVAGGGGLTIFSSQLLSNSDFYTGAFPAEFGNATAGVFDMKLRNGNTNQNEYAFQIGVQGIEAASEGPVKITNQGSYIFNYRYSTMALIFPLLPELEGSDEIPVYQDLSFKFNLNDEKAGTFSIWGIGGLSTSRMKGTDNVEDWIYPESRVKMDFHYNMGVGGLTHIKSLSPRLYLRSTLAVNARQHSYDKRSRIFESSPEELIPLYIIDRVGGAVNLNSTATYVPDSRLTIRSGINASRHFYSLQGDAMDFDSGILRKILNGKGNTWLLQGHMQGRYKVSEGLTFTGGINANWFEMNEELRIEPRLSTSWQVLPRHRFSLGYGQHSQIEPLFVYYVSKYDSLTNKRYFPNRNLERMGAHHFVFGYDFSITPDLRLRIEPYYQKLYNVPVVEGTAYSMLNFRSDWTFNKELVNEGKGENAGIDFTLEQFLKEGFYFISTFSIYDSKYTAGDGIKRSTRYDGGWVLNLLGGKEWLVRGKNMLGINLKITLMGPHLHPPVDIEETMSREEIVYSENKAFSYRNSDVEAISDIAINYRINGRNVSSVFTLQIRNLMGKQYMGKKFNLVTKTIEDDYFTSLIPFVSYKIEF